MELARAPVVPGGAVPPEFKSKPTKAHPLFRGFVQAALARREEKKTLKRVAAERPAVCDVGVVTADNAGDCRSGFPA